MHRKTLECTPKGIREEMLESSGQKTAGIPGSMKGIKIWGSFGSVGEQVGHFSKRVVSRHSMKSSKNPIPNAEVDAT